MRGYLREGFALDEQRAGYASVCIAAGGFVGREETRGEERHGMVAYYVLRLNRTNAAYARVAMRLARVPAGQKSKLVELRSPSQRRPDQTELRVGGERPGCLVQPASAVHECFVDSCVDVHLMRGSLLGSWEVTCTTVAASATKSCRTPTGEVMAR